MALFARTIKRDSTLLTQPAQEFMEQLNKGPSMAKVSNLEQKDIDVKQNESRFKA